MQFSGCNQNMNGNMNVYESLLPPQL